MPISILPTLLAAALALPTALAGEVHIVASDGSGDFLTFSSAYAAAADGDVLYVTRQLTNEPITIDTKGVTVINAHANWRAPSVTVQNIPAGSHVVLRGLSLGVRSTFSFKDCAGSVLLADTECTVVGPIQSNEMMVEDCDAVSIRRCVITPGYFYGAASPAAPGFRIARSNVLIDHSTIWGSWGDWGSSGGICQTCCTDGAAGANGLEVLDFSTVRVQSSTLGGGDGGITFGIFCSYGDSGHPYIVDNTASVTFLDVAIATGGGVGAPVVVMDTPRNFRLPSSVQAGAPFDTRAFGQHGDTIFAFVGSELGFVPLGDITGVFQVPGSQGRRRLGSLPIGGQSTFSFQSPALAPGQVLSVPFQAAFLDAAGQLRLAPADYLEFRGPGVPNW